MERFLPEDPVENRDPDAAPVQKKRRILHEFIDSQIKGHLAVQFEIVLMQNIKVIKGWMDTAEDEAKTEQLREFWNSEKKEIEQKLRKIVQNLDHRLQP